VRGEYRVTGNVIPVECGWATHQDFPEISVLSIAPTD
jgi:hypothetical protein